MKPEPNDTAAGMRVYRAGRTARDVERELGVVDAVRLASNESPFGPLPAVAAAIDRATESVNRYPGVRASGLVDALAHANGVPRANVIVGPGSAGLLWQVGLAYLGPGRNLVAPAPSFEGYRLIAQLTGTRLTQVPLVDYAVSVAGLLDAVADDTAVVVIAEPNNPTGTSVGADGVAQLVDGTRGRCLLVLDEAYLEFRGGSVHAVDWATSEDHVVVLRTFSKAFGLASLRVGYAIGAADTLSYIDRVGPPFSVTAHGEAAAIASLQCTDELDARVRAVLSERGRVTAQLRRHGWRCVDSHTNFVFLPVGAEAGAIAAGLEGMGVIARPIRDVGLRVTIGSPADNDRLVQCLASIGSGNCARDSNSTPATQPKGTAS